ARRGSWKRVLHGTLQVGLARGLAVQLLDAAAFLEAVLAVDHDDVARLQTLIDQRPSVADLRDVDGTQLGRLVRLDDIDVSAGLSLLDGRSGHGDGVLLRVQQQAGIDELPRPQPVVMVWKFRLELDGARRPRDLVVDQQQLSFAKHDLVVLAIGNDLHRPFRHLFLDRRDIGLRKGEEQRDRLDLGDDDETIRIGRMNHVADIDLADTGDAGNGRSQARIAELDVGLVDLRLVGLDGRL